MKQAVYDLEIFPSWLFISFSQHEAGLYYRYYDFEYSGSAKQDIRPLRAYLSKLDSVIGFNTLGYDNYVIRAFLDTGSIHAAKEISDKIIGSKEFRQDEYLPDIPRRGQIDVMKVLDKKGGLKIYECRMMLPSVLECPISFDKAPLTEQDKETVIDYCHNDIIATLHLWQHPTTQKKFALKSRLADQYNANLASETESMIGSIVLSNEIKDRLNIQGSLNAYKAPIKEFTGKEIINPKIEFKTHDFCCALQAAKDFSFGEDDKFTYTLHAKEIAGIEIKEGGLHYPVKKSKTPARIITLLEPTEAIIEYDVDSFYPNTVILKRQVQHGAGRRSWISTRAYLPRDLPQKPGTKRPAIRKIRPRLMH